MNTPLVFAVSMTGALSLALSSFVGKIMLRYRICDAGLVTWLQGLANGLLASLLCVILQRPLPVEHVLPILALAALIILASIWLNGALQEGDASTVIPLMGLKIPITALLAVLLLGEEASPRIWMSVACVWIAVSLFGIGRQGAVQGGHGYKPWVAILLVLLACVAFSVSDIVARLSLDTLDPITLVLWSNVFWTPLSAIMILRRKYRVYRIEKRDIALCVLRGILVLGAIGSLYVAFRLADGVIVPNIIYATRGFLALILAYILNRCLKTPIERQPTRIYALRAAGTGLLFVALLLIVKQ